MANFNVVYTCCRASYKVVSGLIASQLEYKLKNSAEVPAGIPLIKF